MEMNERKKADYAAWIGLDWGSEKHALALQAADSNQVERCTLNQTPEALRSGLSQFILTTAGTQRKSNTSLRLRG